MNIADKPCNQSELLEEERLKRLGNEEDEEIKDFDKLAGEKDYVPILNEDDNLNFSVADPQLVNSHIVYNVKGMDSQGKWEGQRRYN